MSAMGVLRARRSVLPGFGLTLGLTLTYLCLLVLIPLAGLFFKSASLGASEFFAAVLSPRFADIFRNNALKVGLVPAEVASSSAASVMA